MSVTDLIQIVDANDLPTGNETIEKARKRGLIHRIVRVMVEDTSGEKILLQKRTAKLLWPNCWDNSAAGHVDANEDYLTAAKRELFEEIGIKTDKLQELGTYFTDQKYQNNILKRFNRVYHLVKDNVDENVKNDEVTLVRWVSIKDVKKLINESPDQVTDGLVDVISRYY